MLNFREHTLIKKFVHNGFTEKQAETITDGIIEVVSTHSEHLATKQDIDRVESKVLNIQSEVTIIKSELATLKWILGLNFAMTFMMLSLMLGAKIG